MFSHDEMRLLHMCVESEVAFTTTEGTLFRRNSINSTVLGEYGRRVGAEYLRLMAQPTMDKVTERKPKPFLFLSRRCFRLVMVTKATSLTEQS